MAPAAGDKGVRKDNQMVAKRREQPDQVFQMDQPEKGADEPTRNRTAVDENDGLTVNPARRDGRPRRSQQAPTYKEADEEEPIPIREEQ